MEKEDGKSANELSEGVQILQKTPVSDLVKQRRRLVEVPYTASVTDTLNVLLANDILAVPVAAPPGEWLGAGGSMILESDKVTGSPRKHYIGMVSTIDILIHVAECEDSVEDIEAHLRCIPVSSIIGHSLEGLSLWCLSPNTSVYEAMEPFSKGIHRALVPLEPETNQAGLELQEASPGYKMLTQMDIVQYLKLHSSQLRSVTSASVGFLGAVQTGTFAVSESMKVANALKYMKNASLNAVAVVEGREEEPALIPGTGKKLIGNFSATDLRACPASKLWSWLSLSVLEFTEKVSAPETHPHTVPATAASAALTSVSPGPRPLITCQMSSPLEEVLSKVVDYHVHRVWVTDEDRRLVGLVALTDILRAVYTAVAIEGLVCNVRKHPD